MSEVPQARPAVHADQVPRRPTDMLRTTRYRTAGFSASDTSKP
jgi:hypothetical protein